MAASELICLTCLTRVNLQFGQAMPKKLLTAYIFANVVNFDVMKISTLKKNNHKQAKQN